MNETNECATLRSILFLSRKQMNEINECETLSFLFSKWINETNECATLEVFFYLVNEWMRLMSVRH